MTDLCAFHASPGRLNACTKTRGVACRANNQTCVAAVSPGTLAGVLPTELVSPCLPLLPACLPLRVELQLQSDCFDVIAQDELLILSPDISDHGVNCLLCLYRSTSTMIYRLPPMKLSVVSDLLPDDAVHTVTIGSLGLEVNSWLQNPFSLSQSSVSKHQSD